MKAQRERSIGMVKRISQKGFLGWEMFLVIGLVFALIFFALFMLRKSYKACTDEGYGLLECIFNAPENDPYDTKAKKIHDKTSDAELKTAKNKEKY